MRAKALLLLVSGLITARAAPATQKPAISAGEFPAPAPAGLFPRERESDPEGVATLTLADGSVLVATVTSTESGPRISAVRLRKNSTQKGIALPSQPQPSHTVRPRLASDGSRVAAAWIETSNGSSRILASYSPDAGARWLAAVALNESGRPAGADVVLLSDSSFVVLWSEANGALLARRISPDYKTGATVEIAPASTASPEVPPRVALMRDYAGGRTSAQVLLAYTSARREEGVRLQRVTIPEGEFLIQERNCDCAPAPEELRGFPIRAEVTAADPATNRVTLLHGEVPGVLDAGSDIFAVAPLDLAQLHTGGTLLGRIERVDGGGWRIFALHLLGTPAAARGR